MRIAILVSLLLVVVVVVSAQSQPTIPLIPTISGCCCDYVRGHCVYPYKFVVSVYNGNSFYVRLERDSWISINGSVEGNSVTPLVHIDEQEATTCTGGAITLSGNMGSTNTATVCITTVTTGGTVTECDEFTEPSGGCQNPGNCGANNSDCNTTP